MHSNRAPLIDKDSDDMGRSRRHTVSSLAGRSELVNELHKYEGKVKDDSKHIHPKIPAIFVDNRNDTLLRYLDDQFRMDFGRRFDIKSIETIRVPIH